MQIQLKQPEITEAIKLYLSNKGLNLTGKQVTAEFSMTRKPTQVSAEVVIADVTIPGFTDADDDAQAVTVKEAVQLALVTTLPKKTEPEPEADPEPTEAHPEPEAAAAPAETKAEEAAPVEDPEAKTDDPEVTELAVPKKTSSLFSSN